MFVKTLQSSSVADFAALENYWLIVCTFLYICIYKKLSCCGERDSWRRRDSVMVDTNMHNNNTESRDTLRERSCS